jgi:hypothetical protein
MVWARESTRTIVAFTYVGTSASRCVGVYTAEGVWAPALAASKTDTKTERTLI